MSHVSTSAVLTLREIEFFDPSFGGPIIGQGRESNGLYVCCVSRASRAIPRTAF